MSFTEKKDEILDIMEEMEALTPKFSEFQKTFDIPQDKLSDDLDAKRPSTSLLSSILYPKPTKPGIDYPSRPTNETYYDISNKNIGIAVIFNQIKVKGESYREGSAKDAKDLKKVLENIGFSVTIHEDFTTKEIKEELNGLSKLNHSDNDCFLLVMMSHGKEGGKICSKDGEFLVNELWNDFVGDNCKTLVGKPKFFFIQACRGTSTDPGILLKVQDKARPMTQTDAIDAKNAEEGVYVIPTLADLLIMYSTQEGYYSFRNPRDGSWFIQALCQELSNNSQEEIMTILTGVNRRVAYSKQSYHSVEELNCLKQMPMIQSMLTKAFYFLKKKDKVENRET